MSEEISFTEGDGGDANAKPQTTTVTVPDGGVTSTSVVVDYKTMNGNQPGTYSNSVALYQGGPELPWGEKPLKTQANLGATQDGTFPFTDVKIQDKAYVVVYAVGNDAGTTDFPLANVVATAYFTGTTGSPEHFVPSVKVTYVGSDSVVVAYDLPPGQTPQTNGHYLAMWESSTYSYTRTPDMGTQKITSDQASRTQAWNVSMLTGTTYTIAYVAGKKQTDIACAVTFTTK